MRRSKKRVLTAFGPLKILPLCPATSSDIFSISDGHLLVRWEDVVFYTGARQRAFSRCTCPYGPGTRSSGRPAESVPDMAGSKPSHLDPSELGTKE